MELPPLPPPHTQMHNHHKKKLKGARIHTHTCTHTHTHTHQYITIIKNNLKKKLRGARIHTPTHPPTHTHTHTLTHPLKRTHTHTHAHTHTHTHPHTHTRRHTHTQTHTHTHTQHIHTHKCWPKLRLQIKRSMPLETKPSNTINDGIKTRTRARTRTHTHTHTHTSARARACTQTHTHPLSYPKIAQNYGVGDKTILSTECPCSWHSAASPRRQEFIVSCQDMCTLTSNLSAPPYCMPFIQLTQACLSLTHDLAAYIHNPRKHCFVLHTQTSKPSQKREGQNRFNKSIIKHL